MKLNGTIVIDKVMFNDSGKTLQDMLETLPREWIGKDLMEALMNRGVYLSPTV